MLRKANVSLAACIMLAACGGPDGGAWPKSVKPPEIQEIVEVRKAVEDSPLSTDDIVNYGIITVNKGCDDFFDRIWKARDQNDFAVAELAAMTTFSAAILTVTKAGAHAIAESAAVLGLLGATYGNWKEYALLTQFRDELQDLVHGAQKKFLDEASAPTNRAEAYNKVLGYARFCTLAGIHSLARQALATAAKQPTTTTASALTKASQLLGLTGSDELSADKAAALLGVSEKIARNKQREAAKGLAAVLGDNKAQKSAVLLADGTLIPNDAVKEAIKTLSGLAESDAGFAGSVPLYDDTAQIAGADGIPVLTAKQIKALASYIAKPDDLATSTAIVATLTTAQIEKLFSNPKDKDKVLRKKDSVTFPTKFDERPPVYTSDATTNATKSGGSALKGMSLRTRVTAP